MRDEAAPHPPLVWAGAACVVPISTVRGEWDG